DECTGHGRDVACNGAVASTAQHGVRHASARRDGPFAQSARSRSPCASSVIRRGGGGRRRLNRRAQEDRMAEPPSMREENFQPARGELRGACVMGTSLNREAAQLIIARRSVRRYLPKPISPGLLDQLLVAAVAAPSAHNRQPWRFAVMLPGRTT